MIAAPTAAKLMTSAMICRCFDLAQQVERLGGAHPFLFRDRCGVSAGSAVLGG